MSANQPQIFIIAGPNGAGKTTFAKAFLQHEASCPVFINADLIAAGLAPFAPQTAAIRAGKIMLQEIARYVQARQSFALETTLAGRAYAQQIPEWRNFGFRVNLYFLKLGSAEQAAQRVKERVAQGGHDIPADVIARRFEAGWRNFEQVYKPLVNTWALYDNSSPIPHLLEAGENS